MKIPLSWLKEYLSFSVSSQELARDLTMLGLEVDALETHTPSFEKVVVGRIVTAEKHPDAEKLQIAQVTDGKDLYQVVCGASNCRPGLKTAFCPVGAVLTDHEGKSFTIKKAKLRGVESFGMLASSEELGIPTSSEGIIELSDTLTEGLSLRDLYSEEVLEISLTPNLGHCSSVLGVARELGALYQLPVQLPKVDFQEGSTPIDSVIKVYVEDPKGAPRYACRAIEGVKINPSPLWLQQKLNLANIRPINNVVDVTNYILLEMGQPLHAFDIDKIQGSTIVVRRAKEGENIKTLDEKERSIPSNVLVIADGEKPIALAGIMGGANSEVSQETTRVLLEAAYFEPLVVRRGSKSLNLMTDASKKFERGCDPHQVIAALDRAAALIAEMTGGKIAKGVIDQTAHTFDSKMITCSTLNVNRLTGLSLNSGEIEAIFHRLGLRAVREGSSTLIVTVPFFRADLNEEVDLIEEVIKLYGYNNLPKVITRTPVALTPHTPLFLFERVVRQQLIREGLQECVTCDLISPELVSMLEEGAIESQSIVPVLNPTSIDQSLLRPSLLPGLLQVAKYNFDHQNGDVSVFEIGRIHFREGEQFKEQTVAGLLLMGLEGPYHWDRKPQLVDFFLLKGILENVLTNLRVEELQFIKSDLHLFHPGRQASIFAGKLKVGSLGEIHPSLTRGMDLPHRIYYAEFNLHDLLQVQKPLALMKPLPLYPSSERDWTVTISEETPAEGLLKAARQHASSLLESVELVDIYRSDRLGKEKKNVTLHFVYRDAKKTVAQETVDAEHARLTQEVLKQLGKDVI